MEEAAGSKQLDRSGRGRVPTFSLHFTFQLLSSSFSGTQDITQHLHPYLSLRATLSYSEFFGRTIENMSSSNNSEIEKLSLRPDNMVEDELVQITLTVLTKNIAPTLPEGCAIFVYAQWLDVHRQSPSALTQDWVSTSQQWVHALRSLGFSPTEIILGLDEWKMVTGNFPLPGSGSRSLPSSYEIIMWYGNHAIESYPLAGNSDHLGYCKAYECLFGPPPAGYACTRCGVSGMCILVSLPSHELGLRSEQAIICRSVPPTWIPPTIRPLATVISAPSVTYLVTTIDPSARTIQTQCRSLNYDECGSLEPARPIWLVPYPSLILQRRMNTRRCNKHSGLIRHLMPITALSRMESAADRCPPPQADRPMKAVLLPIRSNHSERECAALRSMRITSRKERPWAQPRLK